VLLLVVAEDRGRVRSPPEEAEHTGLLRTPVDEVADRQHAVPVAEPGRVEQIEELLATSVDVADNERLRHVRG
jgi:hypothetical protein